MHISDKYVLAEYCTCVALCFVKLRWTAVWFLHYPDTLFVTIVSDPPGNLVDDDNNTVFEHLIGSNITFTCEVNSTLTFNDSDFVWGCSTGCFADMVEEQTINITEIEVTDSGVLTCSIIINGVDYTSEPYDLQVTGSEWVYIVVLYTFVQVQYKD